MFEKKMRLFYLFNFFKNLQFFGSIGLAFYQEWAGLNYKQIFTLEASFVFLVFLLEIPTGTIADRYGRKKSMALGGLFSGIGFILFACSKMYAIYFVANLFCALGLTLVSGADKALLYDTLLEYKKRDDGRHFISRYEAFGTAGLLIAFPSGSIIAGSGLMPYPTSMAFCFFLSGVSFFLSGASALLMHEPARNEKLRHPVTEGIEGLRFVFNHKNLRGYAFNFITVSAVTFFVFWFYQALIKLGGLPIHFNGFIGAGFNLIAMLLMWNVKRIEKLFTIDKLIIITALLPGICFLAIAPFNANAAITLPLVYVIASSKLMRGPLLSDLMNREIESKNRATVLSGISMLEKALIGLLYIPVGYLADISLPATFIILGITALVMALVSRISSSEL